VSSLHPKTPPNSFTDKYRSGWPKSIPTPFGFLLPCGSEAANDGRHSRVRTVWFHPSSRKSGVEEKIARSARHAIPAAECEVSAVCAVPVRRDLVVPAGVPAEEQVVFQTKAYKSKGCFSLAGAWRTASRASSCEGARLAHILDSERGLSVAVCHREPAPSSDSPMNAVN
jgi:hypothetical protein